MTVIERKRRQALIDEYCELYRAQKKLEVALENKRAEVFALLPEKHPAGEPYTLTGKKWILLIKAAEWVRTITSKDAVLQRVGLQAFVDSCTFPLKAFDTLIPEVERAQFVDREQNGPRKVEVVQKSV